MKIDLFSLSQNTTVKVLNAEPGRTSMVQIVLLSENGAEETYYVPPQVIIVVGISQVRSLRDICQQALTALEFHPTFEQREWLAGTYPSGIDTPQTQQAAIGQLRQRFDLTYTTAEAILETWLEEGKRK